MTEASDQSQSNPRGQRSTAGCLGAVLIHPVALALAFAHGFIYGATPMAHGPAPASGLNGGGMAARQLLFFYFVSFGILPLVISGFGLWFGYWLQNIFGGRHPVDQKSASAQPSLGWRTAVWASGTFLAGFAANLTLSWLLRFTGFSIDRDTIQRVTLMYWALYAAIWGGGAVIAYLRHRSLPLSLWLIGIAFLIRLIPAWIHYRAPYSLHSVAVCILAYAISQVRLKPREKHVANPTADLESVAPEVRDSTVFFLGGATYYAALCLLCLFLTMEPGRDLQSLPPIHWFKIAFWGIPVAGGVTLLAHSQTQPWPWLNNRVATIALAGEVSLGVVFWILLWTN